ncbi:MAG: 50S ribosomal protein L17 [Bacteroidales bacterium]|nr:50S ribosomal protein L17 [Bacteroidales bacterium]
MRHNRAINHLGRQSGHRKAMLANMASSLILSKQIETTVAKAKALRTYVEPLITKSKEDTTHSRRIVFSYLKQKEAVSELFRVVAPKIAERPGGYTRIVRTGFRVGDAADMAIIQLVDFAGAGEAPEKEVKRTSTRRSGGRKNQEGEGKSVKSRKANSPKAANENATKAAPAARKVQAPRKSGNS